MGTSHRRNGFYTVQTVCAIAPTPTLYLNLALTGDCAFQLSPKKPHSVWFISVLKSGDMGQCPEKSPCNTCVIPVSLYKSMSWFVTHTHTHTHTHTRNRTDGAKTEQENTSTIFSQMQLGFNDGLPNPFCPRWTTQDWSAYRTQCQLQFLKMSLPTFHIHVIIRDIISHIRADWVTTLMVYITGNQRNLLWLERRRR